MSIESLDLVNKGDWLICNRGPKILSTSPFNETITSVVDHTLEGCLAKVLAINPPIMLLKIYTKPGDSGRLRISLKWGVAEWGKANRSYVRAYLKKNPKKIKQPEPESEPFRIPVIKIKEGPK